MLQLSLDSPTAVLLRFLRPRGVVQQDRSQPKVIVANSMTVTWDKETTLS